jgi:low temperature requirement protein LtrA
MLERFSFYFLLISSVFILLCMVGLWYCYYSSKQERINYEKMRKEQQREVNSLIDELEKIRQNK